MWGPRTSCPKHPLCIHIHDPMISRESITELVSNTSPLTVPNKKITTCHMSHVQYLHKSRNGRRSTITQRKYFKRKRSHGPSHAITLQATDWEDVPSSHRRRRLLLHLSDSTKSGQVNSQGQSHEYIMNCTRKPP